MFPCEYCEIFKNTYFEELPETAASDQNKQLDILERGSVNYYSLSNVTNSAQSSQALMLKISDMLFNLQIKFIIWGSTLPSKVKNEENRINTNYEAYKTLSPYFKLFLE